MERMEQSVARAIGDRAGRARMNANGSLKSVYRPVCNLIITAEEAYSNVGESAIARSISCELRPGDVKLPELTAVQQRASELNECMRDFYREFMESSINRMVVATERQADKKEQTIVKVGNRTINDAVTTQKEANGFSFTE